MNSFSFAEYCAMRYLECIGMDVETHLYGTRTCMALRRTLGSVVAWKSTKPWVKFVICSRKAYASCICGVFRSRRTSVLVILILIRELTARERLCDRLTMIQGRVGLYTSVKIVRGYAALMSIADGRSLSHSSSVVRETKVVVLVTRSMLDTALVCEPVYPLAMVVVSDVLDDMAVSIVNVMVGCFFGGLVERDNE